MFPLSGPVAGFSPALFAAIAAGYLIGSIPFGLVLTRLAGLGDIRRIGSGNIGATNVLRTGNKALAAATLLLDVGKGTLVVLVVSRNWGFVGLMDAGLFAGLATVLGHNFPLWLKFRGGKGVAATMGVLLGSLFPVGAVACGAWLLTAVIFRYSSLAALVALTAAPVYAAWIGAYPVALAAGALTLLSIFTHRANIERLIRGEEPKIGGGGAGT
ncbi:MAG: glycerol-3-phosphate 1-O-acyltransferase PlsY [Proteobacteria bacterium]|nr:glycerol-3-phosphate 1-O-acyltransferase PlsY [Pseudomonadota bacterium]MCH7833180.1 glycerol-3-phosphate 1-O-acyltransferase PlsY [Pseudomonadota bacterium]